jgi:RecA-family ATPase
MSSWDQVLPPPREWAVRDRIPLRQPWLLSGEGGTGKTILMLPLCVAAALGRHWIGSMPEEGPVIYLGAEDDEHELHRGLVDVVRHYDGATFSEVRDRLFVTSYAGKDATLARFDRNGRMEPTPLYHRLLEQARDISPKIIGLDTISDIFAGNESDRTQVSAFLGLLRALAMASGSAVIINSHPSLSSISSGTGLSGSIAWHNRAFAHVLQTSHHERQGRRYRSQPAGVGVQEEQLQPHQREHPVALEERRVRERAKHGIGGEDGLRPPG